MSKKKTTDLFKKEVYNLVGEEYSVLGEYANNHTHIQMRHNICKYEYPVVPNSFLQGTRCPQCMLIIRGNNRRKTHEEFTNEIYDLVGKEYSVESRYDGVFEEILIKHHICGNTFPTTPDTFLRFHRCPVCTKEANIKNRTKSHEQFVQEVYELTGDEYTVKSNYIKNDEYITILHNACGNEYPVVPSSFLQGRRCPFCAGYMQKNTEQFKQEVYDIVKDEYTLLSEYEKADTYVQIRHNTCGYEYPITPNGFLSKGTRCPKCNGGIKYTQEDFVSKVYEVVKDEYTVLGKYIDSKTHILMHHNICQHKYPVTPAHFLSGRRCPFCAESKGEQKLKEIYTKINIPHDSQYTFDDLKGVGGGLLRYDVPTFHDKEKTQLWFLTEYDGIFHYEKQYDDDGFETLQIHDKRKDEYCKTHNIPLLRIKYDQFDNIESIINNFIQELSNSQQDSSILIAK